ncbi:MAG: prolipoprotein diacylglyceryl transferase family protein, partial [Myxococcota bacterium]
MLNDFLYELFGLRFHGLLFERLLWTLIAIGGSVTVYRGYFEKQDAGVNPWDPGTFFGIGVTLFAAWQSIQAWLNGSSYTLFFTDPLVLHTYGVAIATGFVVAIGLAVLEAKRTGLDQVKVMDISFWALVAGLAGSRLVFMMVEWRSYYNMCYDPAAEGLPAPDCFAIFRFWQGGLVFY